MSFYETLFGKQVTPAEQCREWTSKLRAESRTIDKELRVMERDELKIKSEIQKAAKKGERASAVLMAKGLVRSRKTQERMLVTKTHINSTILELKAQLATVKVVGAMEKSATIMKAMGQIVNVPQVSAVARQLQNEMMKAGLVSEMMDDTFAVMDGDDVEEAADEEVNAALYEVTLGQLGQMSRVQNKKVANPEPVELADEDEEKELDELRARMAKISS